MKIVNCGDLRVNSFEFIVAISRKGTFVPIPFKNRKSVIIRYGQILFVLLFRRKPFQSWTHCVTQIKDHDMLGVVIDVDLFVRRSTVCMTLCGTFGAHSISLEDSFFAPLSEDRLRTIGRMYGGMIDMNQTKKKQPFMYTFLQNGLAKQPCVQIF